MDKKAIQTIRMMRYFIDATVQIIEEEGFENVTIRKVSDLAGYNSATIYNYFSELSHLIFYASLQFLRKYAAALPAYMAKGNNPLEKFLLMWECFCQYSFAEPHIYHAIFSSDVGGGSKELMDEYYDQFPDDLDDLPSDLRPMLLEFNMTNRERIAMAACVQAGYIKEEHAEHIQEMIKLIWQGMLTLVLNRRYDYSAEEATEMTMKYIREIVENANTFSFGFALDQREWNS
ncbi:TetR/AcrR family transcriptional regulator [Natribacillus halophilus]|uniref:DNA-binding transcriptional regulator, AcrR family n=1 Tax=Natribacillus halophilus TaxID=549003 RepID=A0A1G8LXQ2_9BACI|nr:TetR/AcrR family transcriptional regulator [Natribacillus halophilus]SDI60403.1 DNA-binding transcriptional regulator, AcrR family [Natribacillus halophilus]